MSSDESARFGERVAEASRRTLTQDLLEIRSLRSRGVTFIDGKGRRKSLSYAELIDAAARFAGGLRSRGMEPGDALLLALPEPEEALVAILGSMLAGCPPAPIYPPMGFLGVPAFLRYLEHVGRRAQARHVVAGSQVTPLLGAVPRDVPTVRGVDKFQAVAAGPPLGESFAATPGATAFLQFTSGSTASPKGVQVTHGNLSANLAMIRLASRMDESSCVVSWLPVYHDMGLIGTCLNAITMGIPLVVLSPRTFLREPYLWLQAISEHRGTHTAAPNFAYGLCVKRIPTERARELDLSSMMTFICGAEPVIARTMETFALHYAVARLSPAAMAPAYGLAEATLAVTFTPHERGLRCDVVDSASLSRDRVAVPAGREGEMRVPSCGVAMPGLEVRIGDDEGRPLPERHVGEVQIRGPSVTPGYIHDPDATRASRTPDGWLRTGDLGYLAGGELFPCGRQKDVIIIHGRNYHAHDLEAIASELAEVRTGNVVAFGVPGRGESEELVLVAESRAADDFDRIAREIRGRIAEALMVTPRDVQVVPPGTLPKTSSGKLKRAETKTLYIEGRLGTDKPGYLAAWQAALRSGLARITG
jgi:acyl-CoA synthetase (AMP-forming)/AMP-acid ligase II